MNYFSKWTTLLGGTVAAITYYSDPFEVTAYKTIEGEVNVKGVSGGTPTAQLEESSDLEKWTGVGSPTNLAENTLATISHSDSARYVRLAIVVPATRTMTFWAKGVARAS